MWKIRHLYWTGLKSSIVKNNYAYLIHKRDIMIIIIIICTELRILSNARKSIKKIYIP